MENERVVLTIRNENEMFGRNYQMSQTSADAIRWFVKKFDLGGFVEIIDSTEVEEMYF